MKLKEIWRYPVKSMTGHELNETVLNPGLGIPFDRRWALARTDGEALDDGQWASKKNFWVLVNEPRLAELQSHFDNATGRFCFRGPDGLHAEGNLATEEGRNAIAGGVSVHLGLSEDQRPSLLEAKSLGYVDSQLGAVSLLNLSSLAALESAVGREVDAERFRMNFLFEGAEPWVENDWVGKRVRIGNCVMKITKPTGRCKATHVNPETAEADLSVMEALKDNFGHTNLGVYAEVIDGGPIRTGDEIEVLG